MRLTIKLLLTVQAAINSLIVIILGVSAWYFVTALTANQERTEHIVVGTQSTIRQLQTNSNAMHRYQQAVADSDNLADLDALSAPLTAREHFDQQLSALATLVEEMPDIRAHLETALADTETTGTPPNTDPGDAPAVLVSLKVAAKESLDQLNTIHGDLLAADTAFYEATRDFHTTREVFLPQLASISELTHSFRVDADGAGGKIRFSLHRKYRAMTALAKEILEGGGVAANGTEATPVASLMTMIDDYTSGPDAKMQQTAQQLGESAIALNAIAGRIALAGSSDALTSIQGNEYAQSMQQARETLGELRAGLATDDTLQDVLAELETTLTSLGAKIDTGDDSLIKLRLHMLATRTRADATYALLQDTAKALELELGTMTNIAEETRMTISENSTTLAGLARGVCGTLLLAGLGLSILFAFGVTRRVMAPLNQATSTMKDIAEGHGDLTQRLPVLSNDEMGELSRHFNGFVGRIQNIVKDVSSTTVQLATAIQTLNDTTTTLASNAETMQIQTQTAAQGSSEAARNLKSISEGIRNTDDNTNTVASSVEEITSSLNSVGASVEELSASMDSISGTSLQMSNQVSTVAAAMEEMSASLAGIANDSAEAERMAGEAVTSVEATVSRVGALDESAQQIGQIVEVINQIAAQTKLLALNATIEAASAGDAGKGFAVVAIEVKALATQTAEATTNIRGQIEQMQANSSGAIKAIEDITTVVVATNQVFSTIVSAVQEQSKAVNEIVRSISETAHGTTEVSRNTEEASRGTTEISHNVQQAVLSVTEISANINALAGAASEIARQSADAVAAVLTVTTEITGADTSARETRDSTERARTAVTSISEVAGQLEAMVGQFKI